MKSSDPGEARRASLRYLWTLHSGYKSVNWTVLRVIDPCRHPTACSREDAIQILRSSLDPISGLFMKVPLAP